MKNLLFILLITFSMTTYAQKFEIGLGYENFSVKGSTLLTSDLSSENGVTTSTQPIKQNEGTIALSFGANFPLYKFTDDFSAGAYTGIIGHGYVYNQEDTKNYQGQTINSGSSGTIFGYQVPLYLNLRAGAHASNDAESRGIFGIGGGLVLSGFNFSTEVVQTGTYITPAVFAEGGYKSFKVRCDYMLNPYTSHYRSYTGDIPKYKISNFAVHLILLLGSND